MSSSEFFHQTLKAFPCVAILRGLDPEHALDIGQVLFDTGFRIIEVPLNSPDPLKSISLLANILKTEQLSGQGLS